MDKKQKIFIKAFVIAVAVFIFMTLFWRFLGSFVTMQSSYLSWSWNLVRKISTWGFAIFAFLGGLNEREQ